MEKTAGQKDALKSALVEIKRLKQRVRELEVSTDAPLAIVGMSCRFPGGVSTLEQFWDLLRSQHDLHGDIPATRWDIERFYNEDKKHPGTMYTRSGYFLDDVTGFDADFFGISPREAALLDPQQRLLLELAWEAFENATINPHELFGQPVGVYVGMMNQDYFQLTTEDTTSIDLHTATGYSMSVAAGRVAYVFGFTGPAMTIDTACSSSLVALHEACGALQRGDASAALVGGINLMLTPRTTIVESKAGMLSPDGRCKSFDDAADGYGRGEGGGFLLIKRLSDAHKDGDSILGIIRATALNHDGRSSGLTAPHGRAQEAVIREAMRRAQKVPEEITYLEAHGTGTSLGDPIEVHALGDVFRERAEPLFIGSVKSVLGHLESAAAIPSIAKVLLQLQHRTLLPQYNYSTPNRHIQWEESKVNVVQEEIDLTPYAKKPLTMSVSAFGLSGTNGHVILEEPPPREDSADTRSLLSLPVLPLSAHTPTALRALAGQLADRMESEGAENQIGDLCLSAALGRAALSHRAFFVETSASGFARLLREYAETKVEPTGTHSTNAGPGRVAFLYTGQGSQYIGMGRELATSLPVVRDALEAAAQVVDTSGVLPATGPTFRDLLFFDNSEIVHHTSYTQPALYAVQYALSRLLEEAGVAPDVVVGHSVGEYAAAWRAGIWSWEEGLLLLSERARHMGALPSGGGMLALGASRSQAEDLCREIPECAVAVINGVTATVVAGPLPALEKAEGLLKSKGIATTKLTVSHAFHSPLMAPMLDSFRSVVEQATLQEPFLEFIPSSASTAAPLSADYWIQQVREPVDFLSALDELKRSGVTQCIEVGPHPILTPLAKREFGADVSCLASLSKRSGEREAIATLLGELFTCGHSVTWKGVYSGITYRRAALPTYPFERKHFWVDAPRETTKLLSDNSSDFLGQRIPLALSDEMRFELRAPVSFEGHRLFGKVVVPGAFYLSLALAALRNTGLGGRLEKLQFERALVLEKAQSAPRLQVIIRNASLRIAAQQTDTDPWESVFSCSFSQGKEGSSKRNGAPQTLEEFPRDAFYTRLLERGYELQETFRCLDTIRRNDKVAYATLRTPKRIAKPGELIAFEQIDSSLHLLLAASGVLTDAADHQLFVPVSIDSLELMTNEELRSPLSCCAEALEVETQRLKGDVVLFLHDQPVIAIKGFVARAATEAMVYRRPEGQVSSYVVRWEEEQLTPAEDPHKRWVVIGSESGVLLRSVSAALPDATSLYSYSAIPSAFASESAALIFCVDLEEGSSAHALESSIAAFLEIIRKNEVLPLIIVTAGAQPCSGGVTSPLSAAFLGIARVARSEYPHRDIRCIDIQGKLTQWERGNQNLGLLLSRILEQKNAHEEVALELTDSEATLVVPRLINQEELSNGSIPVEAEKRYLITGGLGSLGQRTAHFLAARGAKHLVLLSRSPVEQRAAELTTALNSQGVSVTFIEADISTPFGKDLLRSKLKEDSIPVAGIIHSAGVLDDGMLTSQEWKRFEKVLVPKIELLSVVLSATAPEWVILYSSAAAVLGTSGQANYAAANAVLDATASKLNRSGTKAVSIQWGPWSGGGMAAASGVLEALSQNGIAPLEAESAFAVLERVFSSNAEAALVAAIDWKTYGDKNRTPHLCSSLIPVSTKSSHLSSFLQDFLQLLPHDRSGVMQRKVSQIVAEVLRREPLTAENLSTSFFSLGLDSLTAVEVKERLQSLLEVPLSATVALEHGSVIDLSDFLLRVLERKEGITPLASQVERISTNSREEEVSSLDAELADLEALLAEG